MYFHILCPLFMLPNWVLYPSNLAPFNLLRHLSHLITVCFYSGEIKSRSNIWHHNSCLPDKGTSKICEKFHSQVGLTKAEQGRTKNYYQIGWIGCPTLQVAQKWDFNFLHIKKTWKSLSNGGNTLYCISPL